MQDWSAGYKLKRYYLRRADGTYGYYDAVIEDPIPEDWSPRYGGGSRFEYEPIPLGRVLLWIIPVIISMAFYARFY